MDTILVLLISNCYNYARCSTESDEINVPRKFRTRNLGRPSASKIYNLEYDALKISNLNNGFVSIT